MVRLDGMTRVAAVKDIQLDGVVTVINVNLLLTDHTLIIEGLARQIPTVPGEIVRKQLLRLLLSADAVFIMVSTIQLLAPVVPGLRRYYPGRLGVRKSNLISGRAA